MSNNHNQTANLICAKAIQLIKNYYEHLDKPDKRKQWTDFFMPIQTDHPLMIWNGHILPTKEDIINYAKNLPPTRHSTASINAQPMMGSENDFVVTVEGTVTYGDNHKRRFFHRLTVTKAPNTDKSYISSDYMRWTGEA